MTVTVAPSVTYNPPVWQRLWSVHLLPSHLLPVIVTLRSSRAPQAVGGRR